MHQNKHHKIQTITSSSTLNNQPIISSICYKVIEVHIKQIELQKRFQQRKLQFSKPKKQFAECFKPKFNKNCNNFTKKIQKDKNGENVIQNPSPYNPKKKEGKKMAISILSYHIKKGKETIKNMKKKNRPHRH